MIFCPSCIILSICMSYKVLKNQALLYNKKKIKKIKIPIDFLEKDVKMIFERSKKVKVKQNEVMK